MSIVEEIKQSFRNGNGLIKLIYVNLAVFIIILLEENVFFLMQGGSKGVLVDWLAVPSDLGSLLIKPWTLFTYMFVHKSFFHILSNLIILYFSGQMFLNYLDEKKLITTYIMGGLWGSILFVLFYNIFPVFDNVVGVAQTIGASGGVMAVLVAIATYAPNLVVRLFFAIEVKLKYIAIALFLIDLAGVPQSNTGGHLAHIGGALFGFLFIQRYRAGKDWSRLFYAWVNTLGSLFKSKKKGNMKVAYKRGQKKNATTSTSDQEKIDMILDKISKSGYDSLSKAEKDILFRASNK